MLEEPESEALRGALSEWVALTSAELARVEVPLAVRRGDAALLPHARQLLASLNLVPLRTELLDAAGRLDIHGLRSLDALHVAAALSLGSELGAFLAYDRRLLAAAAAAGMTTLAPS